MEKYLAYLFKVSEMNNKEQALRIIKLLSALEVAGVMKGDIPAYLFEELDLIVEELSKEILK